MSAEWLQGGIQNQGGQQQGGGGQPQQSNAPYQQDDHAAFLNQSVQQAKHCRDAMQALNIDWQKIWALTQPQLQALVAILLQALLSKIGGGAAPTNSGSTGA